MLKRSAALLPRFHDKFVLTSSKVVFTEKSDYFGAQTELFLALNRRKINHDIVLTTLLDPFQTWFHGKIRDVIAIFRLDSAVDTFHGRFHETIRSFLAQTELFLT